MRTPLWDAVCAYIKKDPARFHMPGHKGRGVGAYGAAFAGMLPWDITEVEGADSLFEPSGPIRELEEELRGLYGARGTLLSAGGATLCIQTMLALCCPPGSGLWMGRNIHRSALSACALLDLRPRWIYPRGDGDFPGSVAPQTVEAALREEPAPVYLTSPDYYGSMSDLGAIGALCREYGVPLLVDNAHGAHLKWLGDRHPMDRGASLCCDSLHKTLPAMTGGALMHIGDPRYLGEAKRVMGLFGSTSPSYPILLSCEGACAFMESPEGRERTQGAVSEIQALRRAALERGFSLPRGECDPMKLSLGFLPLGWEGPAFGAYLRGKGIEPEYVGGSACVLMPGGQNREADFERLRKAIEECPRRAAPKKRGYPSLPRPRQALTVREAVFAPQETLPVTKAAGRTAAAPVTPCPPGIPVIMSGELILEEEIRALEQFGIKTVCVVKE